MQFFFLISFVVAQIFTQQVHDLYHLLSNTRHESEYASRSVVQNGPELNQVDDHEHCKFLQSLASQHAGAFLVTQAQPTPRILTLDQIIPTKIQTWISNNANQFHQARAPPVV